LYGIVRPIALAALRLTIISNLVARSIGRSPGFAPLATAKRLRGREGQLIFLSGALERFRRILDSINDLVVSLDWHQPDDLVLATRSVELERAFEIDNLAD
jgi:hypothetical protein